MNIGSNHCGFVAESELAHYSFSYGSGRKKYCAKTSNINSLEVNNLIG